MTARDRILQAALEELALSGSPLHADAVARASGASKALVFHHFGSIEGLHAAMAEQVLRETQAGLSALEREYPNPRERMEALIDTLLAEPLESPREARHVLAFWLGERGAARDALLRSFIDATLRDAHLRPPADAASIVLARWHGVTALFANGGAVDHDAERERAKRDVLGR